MSQVTACIIIIGNEILSGRTHDKNSHWLAGELTALGINTMEVRVVPDVKEMIIETVRTCAKQYDYIFTTGGIGPTHDDITAESIAEAFHVEIELNPVAHQLLKDHYGDELNEARLKMAHIPKGATLIENALSAAPAFNIENVYVMAGIPSIMQVMFGSIKHQLAGGPPTLSATVTGATSEGMIATELTAIQERYADVDIGSYPFFADGKLGVSIVMRGLDQARIDAASAEVTELLNAKGGLFNRMDKGEAPTG